MPIKLGTVTAVGFEDFSPQSEWLGCFRELGCEVVQMYRNPSAGYTADEIKKAVESGGMPCDSIHGIYGEALDPSCPDEPARLAAVETFKAEGELALKLGGPLVVVHCSTIRPVVSPRERAARVDQLKKSIEALGVFGRSAGVRYAFENLPGYHPLGADTAELAGILKNLAVPNTGLCFDTGHANMTGDAVASIRATAGQMICLHLSDNSGRGDEHLMPTHGTLDVDGVARAVHEIGFNGPMILEAFYPAGRLRALIKEGFAGRLRRVIDLANGVSE